MYIYMAPAAAAFFTMKLLKGSSSHGTATIQNLSDTVNA